jgi:hypothetical protein
MPKNDRPRRIHNCPSWELGKLQQTTTGRDSNHSRTPSDADLIVDEFLLPSATRLQCVNGTTSCRTSG